MGRSGRNTDDSPTTYGLEAGQEIADVAVEIDVQEEE
jgi:hypothetical protein